MSVDVRRAIFVLTALASAALLVAGIVRGEVLRVLLNGALL